VINRDDKNNDKKIIFNNIVFNICKNNQLNQQNAGDLCKATTIEKIMLNKERFKLIKIKKLLMVQVKKIAKLAIKSNPGNNDKTIKSTFSHLIKTNLTGIIVKGSKTISRIKKVSVRRIDKKIRITIVFRR